MILVMLIPVRKVCAAESIELSDYMLMNFREIRGIWPDLEEGWNMGVDILYNDDIQVGSSLVIDGISIVNRILLKKHNPMLSLFGLTMNMSKDSAISALKVAGLVPGRRDGIYVTEIEIKNTDKRLRLFIDLSNMEDETYPFICASAAILSPPSGCIELSSYIGKTILDASDLCDEFQIEETGDGITVGDDEVSFNSAVSNPVNPENAEITSITIYQANPQHYCLYGKIPGDGWESMGLSCGLQEGGSGELVDDDGNVLIMYYSEDPVNPHICLMNR